MAITTLDGLVAALPGQRKRFFKVSKIDTAAGQFADLWKINGTPAAASTPASGVGAIPTSATPGAIPFTNPASGHTLYLANLSLCASIAGTFMLYDRLWHNSGMSGTAATVQTVGSPALTRPDANGGDVEIWLDVYTQIGSGASQTLSVSYTNQDGTAGRTGTATTPQYVYIYPGTLFPVTLQAGDTGVRSIQSAQWSGSTGSTGDFGLVLLRRLAEVAVTTGAVASLLDSFGTGLAQVYADAALGFMVMASGSASGQMIGSLVLAEG